MNDAANVPPPVAAPAEHFVSDMQPNASNSEAIDVRMLVRSDSSSSENRDSMTGLPPSTGTLARLQRNPSSHLYDFDSAFDAYRPSLPGGNAVEKASTTAQETKWQWESVLGQPTTASATQRRGCDLITYSLFRSSWVYLVVLGILSSVLAFLVDEAVLGITHIHVLVTNLGSNWLAQFFLYVGYRILILLLGVVLTYFICPNAAGSGIPEMRSILGGFVLPNYLSGLALVSKCLGLTCALGSGLSIGKEGPFVHLSCIIATQLLRLNIFRDIQRSPDLTHHALSAACAVGVTAAFGTPIGGVLFSIEVTTTYYMTSNYWRAFFCSVVGVIMFRWLNTISDNSRNLSLFTTDAEFHFDSLESILFLLLAVGCGVLAGVFVKTYSYVLNLRRRWLSVWGNQPFKYAAAVGFVLAVADYIVGACMLVSNRALIDDMFLAKDINTSNATILFEKFHATWGTPSLPLNLSLLFAIRYISSAISATVAIPNGVFTPVFALGAVLGRLFGETLAFIAPDSWVIVPAGYAIVGAASFAAGVTGTFSIAVIVFELTQKFTYMIPVLLAVLVGRAVAGFISLDMYETIARDRNLPQWPDLTKQASYGLVASDLMHPVPEHFLTRHQTMASLAKILDDAPPDVSVFPVVDDAKSMIFLGVVERDEVDAMLQAWQHCAAGVSAPTPHTFLLSPKMTPSHSMATQDGGDETPPAMTPTSRARGLTSQLAVAGLTDEQSKELHANGRVDLVGLELLSLDAENVHVHRDSFASKVILLISVHKTPQLYVTGKGKLIGVIYAEDLVARSRFLAL
ncbi:Aste57867_22308 [Aphanomyces stellatus]|uniref:Aste57867_22308 protein n=1 Tax=Aphanomyces stellatus TaxID=120398 RepID=A0A485LL80_9STRA|nr:hypothetical protein As57867_022238 [Aphanomyces stellatus]VFT98972.1 Aste57867_22308 [Aphanomyces stellatus]